MFGELGFLFESFVQQISGFEDFNLFEGWLDQIGEYIRSNRPTRFFEPWVRDLNVNLENNLCNEFNRQQLDNSREHTNIQEFLSSLNNDELTKWKSEGGTIVR